MIKQLLAKLIKTENKTVNKNSTFTINSLLYVEIPYVESNVVENHYGYDIVCTVTKTTAILTTRPYIHIKSGKSLKELFNKKNEKSCLEELKLLRDHSKIMQYMHKYNLTEYDKISHNQIIELENYLNLENSKNSHKRTTLTL